ncbi:hypothetical protein EFB14_20105 [Rhizobium fabae]|uniref:Uncharacterized protein n=1 Tax=Rhizobium fabae TaxID=573179 RepID=A0ABY0B6E4_9HYPH|nr:hypothetical protein EFB14_20105 [Rhizobium fabae]
MEIPFVTRLKGFLRLSRFHAEVVGLAGLVVEAFHDPTPRLAVTEQFFEGFDGHSLGSLSALLMLCFSNRALGMRQVKSGLTQLPR